MLLGGVINFYGFHINHQVKAKIAKSTDDPSLILVDEKAAGSEKHAHYIQILHETWKCIITNW